jgi:hypothetical protein
MNAASSPMKNRQPLAAFRNLFALGCAARRAYGVRKESFFAFPALAPQLASSPRDRASLAFGEGRPKGTALKTPAVPLRGTESVRGEQRGIPRFAKTQRCGARTLLFVKEKEVTCRPPSINQGLHAGQIPLALDSLVNGIVLEPSAF